MRDHKALIYLRFNPELVAEKESVYSVFYGQYFNTPDAELIREDSCKLPMNVFTIDIPKGGEMVHFSSISKWTQYTSVGRFITPGHHVVWLYGQPEDWFYY